MNLIFVIVDPEVVENFDDSPGVDFGAEEFEVKSSDIIFFKRFHIYKLPITLISKTLGVNPSLISLVTN